jgi:hypothetical protein
MGSFDGDYDDEVDIEKDNLIVTPDKLDRRKKRKRRKAGGGLWSYLPTEIVCTAPAHPTRDSNPIEWGALMSLLVLFLYFMGFYESIRSLPDPPMLPPIGTHVGESWNLANFEWDRRKTSDSEVFDVSPTDGIRIPASKWPVSIRDEGEDSYDMIVHPGDNKTVMKVPRFWSPPIHHSRLMSRETAMQIGSCMTPDPNSKSFSRGEECPLHERTIFVGIASYRDFECRSTVESIYKRAKYPDRIRVAVVDQIVHGEDAICNAPLKPCTEDPEQALCKHAHLVDVYEMAAELSIGPVYARHIGYRMYRGEYYATQSDAHVTYTTNWDADIIEQFESTHNEMAVLTTYLTDVQGSIDENGNSLVDTRPIMCNTVYEGGAQGMHLRHASQPERFPSIKGSPQLQPWFAAGFFFARSHFVVNVPYDWLSPMIFQGEEMSIGIRGFTIGYDFYAPERSVCFHHYAVGDNARVRNKVHHFWVRINKGMLFYQIAFSLRY